MEAHLVEGRGGGEARDVASELAAPPVGLHDHGESVPADDGADPVLQARLAGHLLLFAHVDGVQVGGGGGVGQVDAGAPRLVDQALDQVVTAIHALAPEHRFEGVQPLLALLGIDVLRPVDHDAPRLARDALFSLGDAASSLRKFYHLERR
jgi:hypothetical protein